MRVRRNETDAPDGLRNEGGSSLATLEPDEPAPALTAEKKPLLQSILHFEITKGRVPKKDLMHFSRQLAVFIRAGIPIIEALDTITEEMGNKRFKEILQGISADLQGGATLSDATDAYPEVFPAYYRGILRSAELTGHLDLALDQLSGYIERDLEARRKVMAALTYPAIVVGLAVVVVVVLTAYVLPRFETFFDGLDAKLPLATRILLGVANWLQDWWFLIVGGLVLIVIAYLIAVRTERGRMWRDTALLKIPVLGEVVHHALLERFCRVFSSMVVAGVALTDALRVTTDAVHNRVFQRGLEESRQAMMRGDGLARPLAATGLFPAAARQMFLVGESTGSLDNQLVTAAEYFDRELDYKIKRLTTIFEPACLLFVGVLVGFVAIALVSAMYGIFRQVKP